MDYLEFGFIGLFVASFLSATILPMSSEAVLILLLSNNFDPYTSLIVATIGNSIGGLTNYFIGSLGNPRWLKRFGVNEDKLLNFELKIKKHGYWLGLFSWLPFIGDPLTIALGFFHVHFWRVTLLLVLGKFLRYVALILPFI